MVRSDLMAFSLWICSSVLILKPAPVHVAIIQLSKSQITAHEKIRLNKHTNWNYTKIIKGNLFHCHIITFVQNIRGPTGISGCPKMRNSVVRDARGTIKRNTCMGNHWPMTMFHLTLHCFTAILVGHTAILLLATATGYINVNTSALSDFAT